MSKSSKEHLLINITWVSCISLNTGAFTFEWFPDFWAEAALYQSPWTGLGWSKLFKYDAETKRHSSQRKSPQSPRQSKACQVRSATRRKLLFSLTSAVLSTIYLTPRINSSALTATVRFWDDWGRTFCTNDLNRLNPKWCLVSVWGTWWNPNYHVQKVTKTWNAGAHQPMQLGKLSHESCTVMHITVQRSIWRNKVFDRTSYWMVYSPHCHSIT